MLQKFYGERLRAWQTLFVRKRFEHSVRASVHASARPTTRPLPVLPGTIKVVDYPVFAFRFPIMCFNGFEFICLRNLFLGLGISNLIFNISFQGLNYSCLDISQFAVLVGPCGRRKIWVITVWQITTYRVVRDQRAWTNNCICMDFSIMRMLETLDLNSPIQRTSQRVKRTSASRVMVWCVQSLACFARSLDRSFDRPVDRSVARSLGRSPNR